METIVAPITAPGSAAVSLLRLSGEKAASILEKLSPQARAVLRDPGRMVFSVFWDLLISEEEKVVLDRGLAVFFKSPKSFTGEDIVEFHLHGSPYLVNRLLENIIALGARFARAGEFSERAFLNGQVDLAQAEAIADLIAAETSAQARVAQEQLAGKLSAAILELGEPLRDVLAEIEANIDFPEEDIEPKTINAWREVVGEVSKKIEEYLASYSSGKLYREGAKVVLCGLPNAGKSSLLNAFLGEERAIVTEIAGTTRDSIEEKCSINGLLVRITDTAGLAQDYLPGKVESLGIERSWKEIEAADLVLYLQDLSAERVEEVGSRELLRKIEKRAKKVLVVGSKVDLVDSKRATQARAISAKTGSGLSELRTAIYDNLISKTPSSVLICTARHQAALAQAQAALARANLEIASNNPAELISLEIRTALSELSEIVGLTHTEDILGRIFSKFCIGK